MRAALWQATAVSLAAHAVVLSQLRAALPEVAPHGVARPAVFTVAMRTPAAAVPAAPAAPAAPAPAVAPEPPVAAAKAPAPKVQEPSPPQEPAPATAPAPAPVQEAATQEAPYLPRGQLTVPPRPLGIVQVAFPEEVTGVVDLKVRLTVFIDETGTVQRVRVDTPNVHPAFERAVRDTFAAARFSPGEVEKVAVRSQMRVEVEFRAPPGSGASAGSRRSPS